MFFFGKGLQHMAEFQTFELMTIMRFALFLKTTGYPACHNFQNSSLRGSVASIFLGWFHSIF